MLRILIADDEALSRDRVKRMLKAVTEAEVIGEAANGLEALSETERLRPDLLFLDIEMPELDGIAAAAALRDFEGHGIPAPKVVFLTGYSDYAVKAFELAAIDYLLKPVTQERLEAAIAKVRQALALPMAGPGAPDTQKEKLARLIETLSRPSSSAALERRLAVRTGTKFVVFDSQNISAIVARDHYSEIRVDGRALLADEPLDSLTSRLNPASFIRVHRSAIINLNHLKELEHEGDRKYVAVMSDLAKTRVPVSRERLPELKSRLGIE